MLIVLIQFFFSCIFKHIRVVTISDFHFIIKWPHDIIAMFMENVGKK